MDPIASDDENTAVLKDDISHFIAEEFGDTLSIHDFRVVKGNTHTNVIFDIVVPFDSKLADSDIKNRINEHLSEMSTPHFAVITVDRSYV